MTNNSQNIVDCMQGNRKKVRKEEVETFLNNARQELRKELIDKIEKTHLDSTSRNRNKGFNEAKKVFINLIKEDE